MVQVALDPARLRARGVDLMRLQQALQGANLALPAGTVVDPARRSRMLAWRPASSCASADDVRELVVGVHEGKPVYLREVAQRDAGRRAGTALCLVHAGRCCGGGLGRGVPAGATRR